MIAASAAHWGQSLPMGELRGPSFDQVTGRQDFDVGNWFSVVCWTVETRRQISVRSALFTTPKHKTLAIVYPQRDTLCPIGEGYRIFNRPVLSGL